MNHGNSENRRRRFRVRLPADSTLAATINGLNYDIIEVAELSIVVTAMWVVNENGICAGSIRWSDGRVRQFTGELGRVSRLGRVIKNIKGFTAEDILKEQRRLLRKFPLVKDPTTSISVFDPEIFKPRN